MLKFATAAALLLVLAGCGEDEAKTPDQPQASPIRVADSEGRKAKCEADETVLNAYCYVKPEGSVSASSVVFFEEADGSTSAECLSGGRNIRIFCVKK